MDVLEIFAVVTTLACVWLMVRQSIWTWPLGLVAVSLYGVFFYRHELYGQVGLQVVYFAFNLYGWYEWLYGGEGHTRLRVSKVRPSVFALLLLLGAVATVVIVTVMLATTTDAASPYFDSLLTAYSLVAQFMTTRKWVESWHIWIAVDIAYVWLFISGSLYLTAGLYAVFIVLAAMGLLEWRKALGGGGDSVGTKESF